MRFLAYFQDSDDADLDGELLSKGDVVFWVKNGEIGLSIYFIDLYCRAHPKDTNALQILSRLKGLEQEWQIADGKHVFPASLLVQ